MYRQSRTEKLVQEALEKIANGEDRINLNNNSFNQIGDSGASRIAQALKVNTSVTVLTLQKNKIGNEGASRLAETLETNSSLRILDLLRNRIGREGILSLANAVKYGATAIRTLSVGRTRYDQVQAHKIGLSLYQLGEGKFGRALKGSVRDGGDSEAAVLKIPHEESSKDALYESLILRTLPRHDNVVKLFGYISDMGLEETEEKGKFKRLERRDDFPIVLAVQLHKNGSLESYVADRPVRGLRKFLQLSLGMSRAIRHLHKYNIIHRDIASRNFVLSDDFEPVLIDFGLSCMVKEGQPAVYRGCEAFPFRQCGPETMFTRQSKKASDVWMLGVTFWQMLGMDKSIPFIKHKDIISLRVFLKERYFNGLFEFPLFNEDDDTPRAEIKELINFCCRYMFQERPTIEQVIEKIECLMKASSDDGGVTDDKYFEAVEGDLSVYAGGDQAPEDYHSLASDDDDFGTMEDYHSVFFPTSEEKDEGRLEDYCDEVEVGEECYTQIPAAVDIDVGEGTSVDGGPLADVHVEEGDATYSHITS